MALNDFRKQKHIDVKNSMNQELQHWIYPGAHAPPRVHTPETLKRKHWTRQCYNLQIGQVSAPQRPEKTSKAPACRVFFINDDDANEDIDRMMVYYVDLCCIRK